MMAMTLVLSVLAGTLAGAVAGGLLTWLALRHFQRPSRPAPAPPVLDPDVLCDIDRAAKAWADSQGQSESAAGLVVEKLRLLYELSLRRNRP
jgi:hypothetical protein